MRSRSSPIKSMFMGVVGRPKIDKNSDGRILLDRVSKTRAIKEKTHQSFSDDVIINFLNQDRKLERFFMFQKLTCNQMISRKLLVKIITLKMISLIDLSLHTNKKLTTKVK